MKLQVQNGRRQIARDQRQLEELAVKADSCRLSYFKQLVNDTAEHDSEHERTRLAKMKRDTLYRKQMLLFRITGTFEPTHFTAQSRSDKSAAALSVDAGGRGVKLNGAHEDSARKKQKHR